jgi:beta-phosphoglucomutase
MNYPQAILFDLDGVLVKTRDSHFQAWARVAKDEGRLLTRQEYEQVLRGMRKQEVLHYLTQGRQYSKEQFHSMLERRRQYYLEGVHTMNEDDLVEGCRDLLGEIRQAGIKTAIASAGKHARLILQQLALSDYFDGIADRYSICNNKPSPDIFLFAAGLVNVPVPFCLAIDDKAPNLVEVKRTGMRVLGVGEKECFHPDVPALPSLAHVCLRDIACCYTRQL